MPIVPTVEGDPADGFVVGTVTAQPSDGRGARADQRLARLTQAMTEPVTVTGGIGAADGDRKHRRRRFRGAPATPQTTRVGVVVGPAPVEWSVAPSRSRHVTARARCKCCRRNYGLGARSTRSDDDDGGMFDATVDVEGLKPGQFQLPVIIVAPARVGVVRLEPAEVKVRVR